MDSDRGHWEGSWGALLLAMPVADWAGSKGRSLCPRWCSRWPACPRSGCLQEPSAESREPEDQKTVWEEPEGGVWAGPWVLLLILMTRAVGDQLTGEQCPQLGPGPGGSMGKGVLSHLMASVPQNRALLEGLEEGQWSHEGTKLLACQEPFLDVLTA